MVLLRLGQALRLEPQFSEAYSNLANALKELGDVRGAMQPECSVPKKLGALSSSIAS